MRKWRFLSYFKNVLFSSSQSFCFSSILSVKKLFSGLHYFVFICLAQFVVVDLEAVDASVIVASVEGEVFSLSIEDEFQITLDSSSVGKKVEEKSIIVTGDSGNASLLFSNGALITIKPGSRFYLRKFAQKSFSADPNANPSQIEEEPSQSELLAHLDFGNLIVKAPKLRKGSSMVLSSPLGTAGIRGTMFQLVAVRNPVTGDITGGVNLISGDITFTDVAGNDVNLASGQSLQLASGKLGESMATMPGGLVNLTATYGGSLTGGEMPPSIDMLFPGVTGTESASTTSSPTISQAMDTDWEMVHEIASDIFFTIESTEMSSSQFSFDDISDAVTVSTPTPQAQAPSIPASISGEILETVEGLEDLYIEAPTISLSEGANIISSDQLVIEYLVKRKNLNYPLDDYGPFKILGSNSEIYPSYSAKTLGSLDITNSVQVSNLDSVNYSILGHESKITLYVDDFALRKVNFADGSPVSVTITPTVKIVDNQKPIISFSDGKEQSNPLLVEGKIGTQFIDPGVSLIDNYYSEQEIVEFMGLSTGPEKSSFGSVNMEKAGVYEITYQGISDPSGNLNEPTTRWVQVVDNTFPKATLYGSNPIYIDLNSTSVFKDPGAFATDNLDGIIEWGDDRIKVMVEMLVDDNLQSYNTVTNSLENIINEAKNQDSVNATFRLQYKISDLAGNTSEISRQIVLINSPFKTPTMVMHGDNPLYHEVNTSFSDPGVTAYKDMGSGVSPINLNSKVSALAYLGSSISGLDSSIVNFNMNNQIYVDPSGNEDASRKIIIKYSVTDEFGNNTKLEREVRIVDSTSPVISLNDAGGLDLLNLQVGTAFTDPSAVVTDNYDSTPVLKTKLISLSTNSEMLDPSGSDIFSTLSNIGFWEPGDYEIIYESTDLNGNTGTNKRNVRVVDTIAPLISVIPHSFLTSPSTNSLNSEVPEVSSIVSYPSNPLPSEILSELLSLPGYDHANKTYEQIDADPYINTFESDKGFYIKDLPADPNDVNFDDSPSGQTTQLVTDIWGRSFIWHSAFKINFSNGVTLQDPGVYVRNDSNLVVTVSSSVVKKDDNPQPPLTPQPYKYLVSYTATQSNGQTASVYDARTIRFIDAVAPTIVLSPDPNPDGTNTFILAEGGLDYGDTNATAYIWTHSTSIKTGPHSFETKVLDAADGSIPKKLVRTVYSGFVNAGTFAGSVDEGNVKSADPITEISKSDLEISQAVSSLIFTDFSKKDQVYTIKYDAEDTANNESVPKFRYLKVVDTIGPLITTPANTSITLDFLSINGSSPSVDVRSEASVQNYIQNNILTAVDAYNFDPTITWDINITKPNGQNFGPGGTGFDEPPPGAIAGLVFPTNKNDSGYDVIVTAYDSSNNRSSKVTLELKIGDTRSPTLTMIGKSEIHDFLRFKSNAGLSNDEKPFTDALTSSSNPELNSTGFAGGDHRMLLADYNFVDPGVYGEDENSAWNKGNGYPDFDGDGIGEGHVIRRVALRTMMDACDDNDPSNIDEGIIFAYSYFEKNSYTMENWQNLLQSQVYGYPTDLNGTGGSAAKVPDVNAEDNSTLGGPYDFNDPNKTDLTNFDMTSVTIEYRVKDSWGNLSSIMTRNVYIYESRQYGNSAFYATPLTDASGAAFESYYDVNGTNNSLHASNPFITSTRKDSDGDGVSDYWEFAMNTNYKDPSSKPDLSDPATFQAMSLLSIPQLQGRLSLMNDASALSSVPGLADFNATSGL